MYMERKLLYLFHRGFYCKNSTSLFSTHHSQQQVWCAYHLLISISHKYFNKRDKNEIAILNPLVSRWHYVIALMNLIIGMFLHGFWYEGSFIFVMWKPEIQLTKRRTMKYFKDMYIIWMFQQHNWGFLVQNRGDFLLI